MSGFQCSDAYLASLRILSPLVVVPHKMDLVVEDELSREAVGPFRRRLWFRRLGAINHEQSAEDVIHCEKRGGHAAARAQELPPVEAQPWSDRVGDFLYPVLKAALLRRLRQRVELAVRDDLGWHRRAERSLFRGLRLQKFRFAQHKAH